MSGFIGATIVNTFVDGALGFAPVEIGPNWSMSRPTLITRLQTLPAKWAMATVPTGILAAGAIATAVGLLIWIAFGTFFVRRYDRQARDRMDPDLLAYVLTKRHVHPVR